MDCCAISESADQSTSGDGSDSQPQTPAIKLRIKIGHETVIGSTKRLIKVNKCLTNKDTGWCHVVCSLSVTDCVVVPFYTVSPENVPLCDCIQSGP